MARIQWASTSEEILGRLAGSVFQDSYMGIQVRGLPKPKNPQTQLQQLRRGNFRFLSSSWRNLTSTQQATFIAITGTIPEALRLFIGCNINLLLIGLSVIDSYAAAPAPDGLELLITGISDGSFNVIATGSITSVPAGCKLLILATTGKQLPKLFTNPSAYQPIIYFDESTDFSSAVNIFTAWQQHYGQLQINTRICIKTAVIDKSNGNRSTEFINCSIITLIMTLQQAYNASITAGDEPQIVAADDDGDLDISLQVKTNDDAYITTQSLNTGGIYQHTVNGNISSTIHLEQGIVNIIADDEDAGNYATIECTTNSESGSAEHIKLNTGNNNIIIQNLWYAFPTSTPNVGDLLTVDSIDGSGKIILVWQAPS